MNCPLLSLQYKVFEQFQISASNSMRKMYYFQSCLQVGVDALVLLCFHIPVLVVYIYCKVATNYSALVWRWFFSHWIVSKLKIMDFFQIQSLESHQVLLKVQSSAGKHTTLL